MLTSVPVAIAAGTFSLDRRTVFLVVRARRREHFFFANQDVDYIKTGANIVHPSFAKTTLRKAQITTRSLHIVFHLQTWKHGNATASADSKRRPRA